MTATVKRAYLREEYLELERGASQPNEFVGGWLFPRSASSIRHNMIAGNIRSALHSSLEGTPYAVYVSQFRVVIPGGAPSVYYPDLIVAARGGSGADFIDNPLAIIEIASQRTAYTDRREKRLQYRRLEGLQTYLIVHQRARRVEVCRRANGGSWLTETFEGDGRIELAHPNTTLTFERVYDNIDFSVQE